MAHPTHAKGDANILCSHFVERFWLLEQYVIRRFTSIKYFGKCIENNLISLTNIISGKQAK